MRNILLLLILNTLYVVNSYTQTGPVCTFNYQAVVRDATDAVIPNRNITVKLAVLDGPGGNALYIETHSATTNSLGLFTLEVGAGARIGGTLDWMAIPWIANRHYLKVEADINGGQNFEVLGESPILAVPIAIQAKFAAFAFQTIDTITKVVQTLCADTLKSRIACLDTIKSFKTYIDELCVDTIPGLVYIEKISGDTACFDYTKIHEGIIDHLEVDSTIYVFKGGDIVFWVDPNHEVFTTDAGVNGSFYADTLHAHKAFVDSICAGNVMTTTSQVKEELIAGHVQVDSSLYVSDGHGGYVFWVDPSKQVFTSEAGVVGEFYADSVESIVSRTQKLYAEQICADKVVTEEIEIRLGDELVGYLGYNPDGTGLLITDKAMADTVCTNRLVTQRVTLTDDSGDTKTVLYVDPIFGGVSLDVTKVYTEEACTGSLGFIDDQGELAGSVTIGDNGQSGLLIDKIVAKDICTNGLLIQTLDGEPLLEVDPLADPQNEYAFTFNHNIMVNGGIMAEFKQFVIDHPLDPENKTLRHFSIESDQMVNLYTGTAALDVHGEAWVQLPGWFEALNKDFSYQLTCIGGYANVYVAEEIKDNKFKIAGGNQKIKVSWQVTGIRHDRQAMELNLPVEGWKTD